jgi:hypothetical protein
MRRPIYVFPLARESKPFRRMNPSAEIHVIGPGAGCRAPLELLIAQRPGRPVILAGFAGGLVDDASVGDVMVAGSVVDAASGREWRPTWSAPGGTVRVATTERIIATPEEKRALHAATGAAAVDMEAAIFAEACARAGAPWLVVRAISDAVTHTLPPEVAELIAGGESRAATVFGLLARRPALVVDLLRLARSSARAAYALAAFLTRTGERIIPL